MKASLRIVCTPVIGCAKCVDTYLLKDYDVVDVLQALGIASSASGLNFLDVKGSQLSTSGNDKSSYYIAKATHTTSFVLTIKD